MIAQTTETFLKTKLENMYAKLLTEFGASEEKLGQLKRRLLQQSQSLTSFACKLHEPGRTLESVAKQIVSHVEVTDTEKATQVVLKYLICFADVTWSLVGND